MKVAIDASIILKEPLFISVINILSGYGYKVYITYDSSEEKKIVELLEEKKCVYEDLKKYDKDNKYKILSIMNLNYIMDEDTNLVFAPNQKLYSNARVCLYNNDNTINKNFNVFQTNELKGVLKDILEYETFMKKHIEDPITVLSGKPSIDKIWSRTYSLAQQDINFNEMSIWEYIYLANYGREDEVALRYFGKTMTFKELYKKVDQFALNLVDQGVKQGDVVTICMPNTPEGVIAFLATNKIGAVASMLHPLLKGNDILDTLESTKSKVMVMADTSYNEVSKIIDNTDLQKVYVVSPGDSMPVISNIQPGIKFIYFAKEALMRRKKKLKIKKLNKALKIIDDSFKDIKEKINDEINKLNGSLDKVSYNDKRFTKWKEIIPYAESYIAETLPKVTYEPYKTSILLRTGGTTGRAKLAELSNESVIANISQVRDSIPPYSVGDEVLAISPIFHGFGLIESVLAALGLNMSVDLHPRYDKTIFVKSLIKNKPALILGVPTLFKNLIKDKKLNNSNYTPRAWISGGDTLPETLKHDINVFRETHNASSSLGTGYGFTEGGAAVTISKYNSELSEGSVGYPLPYNNIKIVDPKTGEELGFNEVGEIWVSGPTIMNGYYDRPESTEKAIKIDANGTRWYHTGDLGKINENGELCFGGRDKNLIIVSGVNVFGSEIEPVVLQIPEILDCAVVGMPHEYKMNVPMAYVVLKEGITLDEQLKNKIKETCNSQVDTYHKIYDVVQIDRIPLTALSKVDYKVLEAMNNEKYSKKEQQKVR